MLIDWLPRQLKPLTSWVQAEVAAVWRGKQLAARRKSRHCLQHSTEALESRCLLSATTVGANVDVTPVAGNQNNGTIAVDPTNPTHLAAFSTNEAVTSGIYAAYSTNSGATWTGKNIGTGSDGLPTAGTDAQAVFDKFGNLFVTYKTQTGDIAVLSSADGGQTFSVLKSFGVANADQPSIAVGTGSVWVAYTTGSGQIVAAGASISGLSSVGAFGAVQLVPGSSGNYSDIAVGPAGQVVVAYQSTAGAPGGPGTILQSVDADGLAAGGFAAQTTLTTTLVGYADTSVPGQSNSLGINAGAHLAWDLSVGPQSGRLYAVYTDAKAVGSADTDVYVRHSDNNGATWSAAVKVNDDQTTGSQFLPSIAVDQTTGNVAVAWYDTRANAASNPANVNAQQFTSFSTDGGLSFLPNVQVSTGTSKSAASEPPQNGFRALGYGDFIQEKGAFTGGVFHPIWADNSNSTGTNPDGTLSRLDLNTATVTLGTTTPGPITIFGTAGNDNIVLSAGLTVDTIVLNGVVSTYSVSAISSITINSKGGTDVIDVLSSNAGFTTTVISSGTATVNVGNSGTLQQTLGPVFINNAGINGTTVNVDDSADTTGRTAIFSTSGTSSTITGLAPVPIMYDTAGTAAANVKMGTGTNTESFLAPASGGTHLNVTGNPLDTATFTLAGNNSFVGGGVDSVSGTYSFGYATNATGYLAAIAGPATIKANALAGGSDVANLVPASNGTVDMNVGNSVAQGTGYEIDALGFGATYAYGSATTVAKLHPKPGDQMIGTPASAYVSGTGYLLETFGFGNTYAYGNATNSAIFYPGTGDKMFGDATTGYIYGSGYVDAAVGFGNVYAYGDSTNVAQFYPATGDRFKGAANNGYIYGNGYVDFAGNFGNVYAYGDASNVAEFYPGTGGTMVATFASGYVTGPGYVDFASGFGNVYAYGDASNSAQLTPATAGTLIGTAAYAYVFGTGYVNYAGGFGSVTSTGDTSNVAQFFPGTGGTFTGGATSASITGTGYSEVVNGYGNVGAIGDASNTAILTPAAHDNYVAKAAYAYINGTSYVDAVYGFGNVQAHGDLTNTAYLYLDSNYQFVSKGGDNAYMNNSNQTLVDIAIGFGTVNAFAKDSTDVAFMYDSPGNDLFYGRGTYAGLFSGSFIVAGSNFGTVNAFSVYGGVDHLDVAGLNYIFNQFGSWL